jgi:Secretion system C-terminal sorting domain
VKRLLFFFALMSSALYGQGVYLDLDIEHIGQDGWGSIEYNFYTDNCTYVQYDDDFSAKLQYPDGSWTNWNYGEIGGWWFNEAGTYHIQGRAWAYDICLGGAPSWRYTPTIPIEITDNYAPSIPQNFQVSTPLNQNPVLSWDANTEGDLDGYRVYKKYTTSSGTTTISIFTTNTSYTDGDFTANYKTGEDIAEYWVVAEDINNNISNESVHRIVDGTSGIQWKINSQKYNNKLNYFLNQNYPNPFNPTTSINYQIKEKGFVSLKVYNVLGKLVLDLVNETKEAGEYSVTFDAGELPSGVYIYSLIVNNFVQNRKMSLMK